MSETKPVESINRWATRNDLSDGAGAQADKSPILATRMPGIVAYTCGGVSLLPDTSLESEEQVRLSAALDVALQAVRQAKDNTGIDRSPEQAATTDAIVEDPIPGGSNVISITDLSLMAGDATGETELDNSPPPIAPFAPVNDLPEFGDNEVITEEYFAEYEQDDPEQRAMPDIPQSIHVQAANVHLGRAGVQRPKGVASASLFTGIAAIGVAGFLGFYFSNSPATIIPEIDFPAIFQGATTPNNTAQNSVVAVTAPNTAQPLIAPVQVNSVAVRSNPRLAVEFARGESGTDLPLSIRIDPVPGENTSVVINGLPDGAALTSGVESTKGVWILQPVDLADLALRTPLGISGEFNLGVELVASSGESMDRKVIQTVLSSSPPSTVPVTVTSSNSGEQDPSLPVDNAVGAGEQESSSLASAYAPTTNPPNAFANLPASLLAKQEKAKINGLMITRGDNFLANGDFSSARLLFERAGKQGSAVGATLAAMTYDPVILNERTDHSMRPNPGSAQVWYARAIGLGSDEARTRRSTLDTYLAKS